MNGSDANPNSTLPSRNTTTPSINIPFGVAVEIAIFLIILENSLILLTLRLYKGWKVVDLLVLSLSLADFINALLPMQILNVKVNFLVGPWSDWLCGVFVWATYTLRMASVSTVTLMSVERALLLYQPLRYYTQMTLSLMRKLIFLTWGLSAIAAALPKFLERTSMGKAGDSRCRYQPFQLGFAFGIFIEAFGTIQFGIVLGSYVALVLSSKGFLRRQRSMMASQKRQEESPERSVQKEKTRAETQGMLQAKQLCHVMGSVVLLYYLTWLPFLIYNFYNLLTQNTVYNQKMVIIVGTCSLATPILNPFLYVIMVNRYRQGVIFILRRVALACRRNKSQSDYDKHQRFSLDVQLSSTSSARLALSLKKKEDIATAAKSSTTTLDTFCEADTTTNDCTSSQETKENTQS